MQPIPRRRRPTSATGLQILRTLADGGRRGIRLKTVADSLDLDPGLTHRILKALVEDGWVSQPSPQAPYKVTAKILELAGAVMADMSLVAAGSDVLHQLAEATGEAVHLAELRDDELVCVAREDSKHSLAVVTKVGQVWPLDRPSAVAIANRSAWALRTGTHTGTAWSVGDPAVLSAAELGYSIDDCGYRAGIRATASPILGALKEPIGAIALSGPSTRLSLEQLHEYGVAVRDAAHQISRASGWTP